MQKIKITKSLLIEKYNQDDYLNEQKQIYDDINIILNSFDFDKNLTFAREYLDNLNGDIFLNDKKFDIFVLKINKSPISFLVFCNGKIDLIWTDFEFAKLGYATILLRVVATELWKNDVFEFCCEVDDDNLIASNLFDSFGKVDGVKILDSFSKNGKKTHKFDIKNINNDQILQKLRDFAI